MFSENIILLLALGCILHTNSALAVIWSCSNDTDCTELGGSVCTGGECVCPPGSQTVLGGSQCAEVAPYLLSPCLEDFQCSRLFTSFNCRRTNATSEAGNCFCQPGNHYFRGRCWPSVPLGEPCARDEHCQGVINEPFSMSCNGVCECADGYYLRQRGECRRIGAAVGEGCVLDEDCQFPGGACDVSSFTCYNANDARQVLTAPRSSGVSLQLQNSSLSRSHGTVCDAVAPCVAPFECSALGICHCPTGYYPSGDDTACLAELGSPVTSPEQCVGVFTEIRDGICSCQANFFFNEDMRTCVKASRFLTDSCTMDANCHTFGVHARCGPPQLWGLRSCECDLENTIWDANRQLCRLFAGIGETCEVNSDCMAGELEINCVGGTCACPDGFVASQGLCLTLGLNLGDSCQLSMECTGTPNLVCSDSVCSCDSGYQPVDDLCAPALGGTCSINSDCLIEDSVCSDETSTCQCGQNTVEFQDQCWPGVAGHGSPCNITEQCSAVMGVAGACVGGACDCADAHHYRDGQCWPQIGLFENCARSSECYLSEFTDRVQCRNSVCQCVFDYPYDEELGTCRSSATTILGHSIIIATALFYLFSR